MIYTRTVLRVDEGFKGRLPAGSTSCIAAAWWTELA